MLPLVVGGGAWGRGVRRGAIFWVGVGEVRPGRVMLA